MLHTIETRFYRKGSMWIGCAKVTGPYGVRNFAVSLPITQADVERAKRALVSGDSVGWFGSDIIKGAGKGLSAVANAASKITKAKVVQKLGGIVKDVVKSDVTKFAVGAVAVAFPPVGVPAAAALATANTVLDSAEKADRYVGQAKNLGKNMQTNPTAALRAGLSYAATGDAGQAQKLLNAPAAKKAITQVRAGVQAKKIIAETVRLHQAGHPQATKFLKTLVVAKRARRKLAAVKSVVAQSRQAPGILVLSSGELLRGSFATAGARRV